MRRLVCLALALAPLTACSSAGLDGSLSDAFDLSYNTIELKRSPTAFSVSYLRSAGREVVVRVIVATEGLELAPGMQIQLGGEYAPGHPRARVTRAVDGEPVRVLPNVERGTMSLDVVPEPGGEVSGDFSLLFGEGGDMGSGRTLEGTFSGVVEGAP